MWVIISFEIFLNLVHFHKRLLVVLPNNLGWIYFETCLTIRFLFDLLAEFGGPNFLFLAHIAFFVTRRVFFRWLWMRGKLLFPKLYTMFVELISAELSTGL